MFKVLAFRFELNYYILTSSKSDLDEVDKAIIIVLPSHFELIFCLLTRPKWNLRKVKKAAIQGIWNLTFNCSRLTVNFWPLSIDFDTLTQNLSLHQLKFRLTRRRWSDDYSSRIETLNSFSAPWPAQNVTCVRLKSGDSKTLKFVVWTLTSNLDLWILTFDF